MAIFFFLSKVLDVFFSPLGWTLALLACAILGRSPGARRGCTLGALGVLLFFSLAPVSNSLIRGLELPDPTTLQPEQTYDAVLVLGGLVNHGATRIAGSIQYNEAAERILVPYELLQKGKVRNVLLSSGPVDGYHVVEAELLAQQLENWGIAPERIFVEGKSRNTRENALFSKPIVETQGWKSVLLVTSAAHMSRALDCCRAVGLAVDPLAVDFHSVPTHLAWHSWVPRVGFLDDSSWALREYAGRGIYRMVGFGKASISSTASP